MALGKIQRFLFAIPFGAKGRDGILPTGARHPYSNNYVFFVLKYLRIMTNHNPFHPERVRERASAP